MMHAWKCWRTAFVFVFACVGLGIQLGLDMLGRSYSTKTICYFNLVSNYMLLPQRTTEERVRMVELSFYICWVLTYLSMVSKWCPWGGWPSFKTLERHKGQLGVGMSCLSLLHPWHSQSGYIAVAYRALEASWVSSFSISCIFIYSL